MKPIKVRLALVFLLTGMILFAAAENSIVGTWQVVSDSPDGDQYRWTLAVKEVDGKLTGTLSGEPGQFPLIDLKSADDTFTCRVKVEGQTYGIEIRVSGARLEGSWKGASSQGFIKGTRQS